VINRLLCKISQQFTQRLRTVEDTAVNQTFYLPQKLFLLGHVDPRNTHVTRR